MSKFLCFVIGAFVGTIITVLVIAVTTCSDCSEIECENESNCDFDSNSL